MKRETRRVRWADMMRYVGSSPRTISEIAKYMKVHYVTAYRYLIELIEQDKIEVHEEHTKPIRYRKKR